MTPWVDKDINGKLVITVPVILEIGYTVKSKDVAKGTVVTYTPHKKTPSDASFSLGVYEAVLGHERGHAKSYFQDTLPAFEKIIRDLKIDESLSIDEIEQKYNFGKLLAQAVEQTMASSLSKANSGTYSGFDSSWKQLDDLDGNKRWVKE